MAKILFNEATKEFHLQNERISYIFCILENGQLGHLYFGKRLTHRDSFQHFKLAFFDGFRFRESFVDFFGLCVNGLFFCL